MKYSLLGISLGIIAISILVIGSLFVGFAPSVSAINVTDTATIDLNVSELTLIDMNPAEFAWLGVDPGTNTSTKQVQIENIGSTNFTKIWFNVTQEASRPFGTGDPSNYIASNFLWIAKEGQAADSSYFAVDRREFNETRSLIYLTDPDGNIPPNQTEFNYGRFRNTSFEYFWFTDAKKTGDCTGANFYVGDDYHSQSVTGTIDFSACAGALTDAPAGNCRSGTLNDATNYAGTWCYADINIGGRNYTITVNNQGDQVRWFHWNAQAPGGLDQGDGSSLHNDFFSSSLIIYPGNSTVADLKIYLPYGVAKDDVSQGVLTVICRSDEGS